MQRVPEPEELMDDPAQAAAYAGADFSEANELFIRLLRQLVPQGLRGRALDLGCGPADIPIALLREYPALRIDAIDGAPAMLEQARQRLALHPGVGERLHLSCQRIPSAELPAGGYDCVMSNSLLHHLREPGDLWLNIAHCAARGAAVLVMDLARPESPLALDALVETYALNEPEILRRDFRNSLCAAWTVDEVREQIAELGLRGLEVSMVSDRHWAARGHLAGAD